LAPQSVYLPRSEDGRTRVNTAAETGTAFEIAHALGVNPTNQIIGKSLVVFVHGPSDKDVLRAFAKTLGEAGRLSNDFNAAPVAMLPPNQKFRNC
jgi:hypothetical protein